MDPDSLLAFPFPDFGQWFNHQAFPDLDSIFDDQHFILPHEYFGNQPWPDPDSLFNDYDFQDPFELFGNHPWPDMEMLFDTHPFPGFEEFYKHFHTPSLPRDPPKPQKPEKQSFPEDHKNSPGEIEI
jgi:hypothetical protein